MANFRIAQATPSLTWSPPAAIVYGTAIGATQLDAAAGVGGRLTYTPAIGAVLGAGVQTLSVTFTPNDDEDYASVTTTTTIAVGRATPTVSVTDGGGTYNGSPFAPTAVVAGIDGQPAPSLEGIGPRRWRTMPEARRRAPRSTGPRPPRALIPWWRIFPAAGITRAPAAPPVTFEISAVSATVTLTSTAGSAVYGQSVTLTATVMTTDAGAGPPTGTVTFLDGNTTLGVVPLDASGQATLTVSSLDLGCHSITATYSGDDGSVGGQSAAVPQSVAQDGTTVLLVPHPVLKRKKVTQLSLTAEIEPVAPGGGVPTGVVSFMMKKKKLGTVALVNGQATLSLKPRSILNKTITVIYGGGADFQSSTLSSPRLTSRSLARPARMTRALVRQGPGPSARPSGDRERSVQVRISISDKELH